MSVRSPKGLTPAYDWHVDHEQIGRVTRWVSKTGREVEGVCTGCQLSGSQVMNLKTGETWAGIRFRIQPDDGSRAVWTTSFADYRRPQESVPPMPELAEAAAPSRP